MSSPHADPSPPALPDGWSRIPGWLTAAEARTLMALAAGRDVLELGAYAGRSTVALATTARHVTSIDHHAGDAGTGPADTLTAFRANLDRFGVAGRVRTIVGPIEAVGPTLADTAFDLIFIDSAHDAASVARDARLARRVARPGAIIAFHDRHYAGVRAGMAAVGLDPGRPAGTADTLAWFKLPA